MLGQLTDSDVETIQYLDIMERWPRLWLALYHSRTTRGGMLTFHDKPWLITLYKDKADKIVVQKASQLGLSDWAINETFSQAIAGRAVMYVLPTDRAVFGFTPRRVDRLINTVPLYRRGCVSGRKASDSKSQKTLFGVDCHFVGANSVKNFYEKPCDVLIIDEIDMCDQSNLTYAYDRLGSSQVDGVAREVCRKLGNPTIAGWGISEAYDKSCRFVWLVPCPHCGEKQEITWASFVDIDEARPLDVDASDVDDIRPICCRCHRPMDRLAPGEWVAHAPGIDVHGYKVSKLFGDVRGGMVMRSLLDDYVAAQNDPTKLQRFYNNILGEVHNAEGARITIDMLAACESDYKISTSGSRTVAGVDVGAAFHVHIEKIDNGIRRKLWVGHVREWNDLQVICHQYGVERGVIDGMPETHGSQEWCEKHPGWLRCFYSKTENAKTQIDIDHKARTIQCNRTATLDASYGDIASGRVELFAGWRTADNGDFVRQMTAATRVLNEEKQRYEWQEGNLPDHHQHADNYCRLAGSMYAHGSLIVSI